MPLTLSCVVAEDFEVMKSYAHSEQGDLVSPIVMHTWVDVPTTDAEMERNLWSMKQQLKQFQEDKTAVFLKVTDNETGEIISLARWHLYPEGFQADQNSWMEVDAFAPPGVESDWPERLNVPLHKGFLEAIDGDRPRWQGNQPCWGTSFWN